MSSENKKPNCYECIHRRGLMGDAHSRCAHPEAGESRSLGPLGRAVDAAKKLGVTGNLHGIQNGWFFWPSNFDPVWLEACDGFTEKEDPDDR